MKKCFKCNNEKDFSLFSKNKRTKDGYSQQCKDCAKIYYLENKESINIKQKLYNDNNKEKIKEKRNEYYQENKESINLYGKKYYNQNKDSFSKRKKEYNKIYKEQIKAKKQEYYINNKEIIKEKRRNYVKLKLQDDMLFRLKKNIRTSILNSIKKNGYSKKSKTELLIGCTFEYFKLFIEDKFESWMNWENYGKYNGEFNYGWDIDHIIPLSSANTEEEVLKLNHYSNLQPLCSYINRVIKRNHSI